MGDKCKEKKGTRVGSVSCQKYRQRQKQWEGHGH